MLILEFQQIVLFDSNAQKLPSLFHKELKRQSIEAIIGVHLYRAGRFAFISQATSLLPLTHFRYFGCSLLIDCKIPFVLIIGGTDINEHVKQTDIREVGTSCGYPVNIF